MNLNQTILDAARDEVAKENGFNSWEGCMELTTNYTICFQFHEQAALLAMDRLAAFKDWKSIQVFDILWNKTELELYEIWEGK